ncbi:MAG TPA: LysR substrate-binding domain-containing protein, partial [Noviherbaspirillum sp.]|nr:LysR substrate-binding domain-containing protein [Noviherbaspirillum sp.]
AAAPSLALGFLPRVMQRFMQACPDVAISLHTNTSATVEHWTRLQYCDLGLAVALSEGCDARVELLGQANGVCILPRGHRLAALPEITPAALRGETLILPAHGDGARERIEAIFRDAGVELAPRLEAQYAAACCAMVGLGMGVAIVNPLVVRDYCHMGIEVRPFAPALPFPAWMLAPANRPTGLLAERFAATVRAVLQEEMETFA